MKKEIIKFYSIYKLYVFPAVVALCSLFLIVFAIYPQTVKLIDGQRVASELISKSKFLETKVQALESYNKDDLLRKTGIVLYALPSEKDYGNVLTMLQQLVAQSGFSITSITVGNATGKLGNLESFEVKLDLKGSRILLQILLENLENSPRLVRIKSIDVSSGQSQQDIDISLVLQVLYSKLPQDFGMTDSPLPELDQKDENMISALEKVSAENMAPSAESPRGKVNPFE